MVTIRGGGANNQRSASAATHPTPDQQHKPLSKAAPSSSLPGRIPPGTAASEFEHIFMDHCEFRSSPVHGFGVFATRDIQPGTLIIKEKALWVVDALTAMKSTFSKTRDYGEVRHNMIKALYESSTDDEGLEERLRLQEDILSLCGGFTPEERLKGNVMECMQTMSEHLREILILNGVTESGDDKPGYAAVFRASSRLNHSCFPNAERMRSKVNNGSVWCMVYATSLIEEGEEIFVNYVDPLATSDTRQKLFQSRWRFTCTCRLCTRPQKEIDASDERRKKILNAMNRMRDAQKKHAEPKFKEQKDTSHMNHLVQCDKATLGEAGWETIKKYAAMEGVSDLKLFNSITHAADAARRLKKLSLEMRLVDRLVAVCRTYDISDQMTRNVESRRTDLHQTAKDFVRVAEKQVAAKQAV